MNAKTNAVKVRINYDGHIHAGKPCKKGDVVPMSPGAAKRLAEKKTPDGKTTRGTIQ